MDKDWFIKLTLAVYRVTELFPEGEPLKFQIREEANKILTALICSENSSRPMEALMEFFDLAKAQNWVNHRNFLVLEKEYAKIQQLEKYKTEKPQRITNQRQAKILSVLRSSGRVKTGELLQTFPQFSRRTLARDLEELFRQGVVARNGTGRGAHYCAKM